MDEQALFVWLSGRADAATLFVIAAAVLVVVEAVKRLARRLWDADFDAWWLLGAGLGTAAGLAFVDLSLAGAGVGLVVGCLATGGFEYLKGAGVFLGGRSAAGVLLVLGFAVALCTAGCGGHGYILAAQDAQLKVLDQVAVAVAEYDHAARAELDAAEAKTREALRLGLAEDLFAAAQRGLDVNDQEAVQAAKADAQALVDAVLAEYDGQLASLAAERAVLADRRARVNEILALGRQTATRAAEIEVRRFEAIEAVKERLLELMRERAGVPAAE